MYTASSSRMARFSVACSAGTTMSRRMRSTIFISRSRTYHFLDRQGRSPGVHRLDVELRGAGRRLDQAVAPILTLVDDRDPAVGVVAEHQKWLVHEVELHDGVRH